MLTGGAWWAAIVAALLVIEATVNAYLAASEQAWFGMAFAAVIPLAALYTWWTQRRRSAEIRAVADAMIIHVMLALTLYSWAMWP